MIYLLAASLFLNILFVFPLLWRKSAKRKPKSLKRNLSDDKLLSLVAEASVSNKKRLMLFYEPTGTVMDYFQLIRPRGSEIINNFQNSYLLYGLTSYALAYSRKDILDIIITRVDKSINRDGKLTYQLRRLDQIPFGMTLMLLNHFTTKNYSAAISQIYNFVLDRYKSDGTMLYMHGTKFQHVDSLGMYVPFLSIYGQFFNDNLSKEIIHKGVEEYLKYGVDDVTGMPAHGFNRETKIKIGSINWGRGLGWYLLGLSFVDDFNDERLNKSINELELTQFPGQISEFDSSTALMVNIYKYKKELKDKPNSLDFIKPHISKQGNVESCSGDTYTYNRYAMMFGPSELSNGLLLYLGSLLKTK